MLPDAAADREQPQSVPGPRGPSAVLLVVAGLSLVGAGLLLWSRHGAAVFVQDAVLAAIAWCF